jgi:hypothetical protein
MSNFDLIKYLSENKLLQETILPLESIGAFIDTKNGTLHPMNTDGTMDVDPGMAVDIMDADHYEIMDQIEDGDKEIYMSVLKTFEK